RMEDFDKKMQEMFPKVGQFVAKNNITVSGSAFVIYHKWDEENNTVMFSCAMPTPDRVVTTSGDILTGQLEPFKAVKTTLTGDYSNLKEAWDKGMKYIEQYNLEFDENSVALESYVTDPMNEPNPAKWITEIYMPIK
ncbi:MAG: GyrI-like domain-containing protein, partial [Flavobacteriaceae bacterium]|nr:GyrI-like domain-containing protein [Flavobacteriaceae bacterium]